MTDRITPEELKRELGSDVQINLCGVDPRGLTREGADEILRFAANLKAKQAARTKPPTFDEQMDEYTRAMAVYGREMAKYRDGLRDAPPPRPVRPHTPGFLPPAPQRDQQP